MTDATEAPELEQEPAAAATLFGERLELARSFTGELARRGEELGLIGPLELPRLWTRHILNSALLAPLLEDRGGSPTSVRVAGSPAWSSRSGRPDVTLTLIEPMERRCEWLTSEAARLGLDNVTVVRGRAEDVADDIVVDQVTARAVSALSKLIPLTVPLVRSGVSSS